MLLDGEPVRILGNTSSEGFGEETLRIRYEKGSRAARRVSLTTPAKTVVHRRSSRQSESTKCVRHMNTQMTQKTVEFLQPQFINKVVDHRVTTQRQIPLSKWR